MLLIRPQQKRQRQLQDTISQLKIGDRVVTTGGVIGTITTVRDTSFIIRSADKSILEIARTSVAGVEQEEKK
jgi:preprotein translocase subunit YajC